MTEKELLLGKRDEVAASVGDSLFDWTGGKEHPTIVVGSLLVRRSKARERENVGEIGYGSSALADDVTTTLDCRYLSNRIDFPEKTRLLAIRIDRGRFFEGCTAPLVVRARFLVIEHDGLIMCSCFLEHPADHTSPRVRICVDFDSQCSSPVMLPLYDDSSSFYRSFKSWEKTSPRRWRKKHANDRKETSEVVLATPAADALVANQSR